MYLNSFQAQMLNVAANLKALGHNLSEEHVVVCVLRV